MARQSPPFYKFSERILGPYMEQVIEFVDEVTPIAGFYECDNRLEQRPADRKPNLTVGPQTPLIELGDIIECVVPTTVRVARETRQFP